tara:strand:- start:5005 stop:5265 length:261 start_codon:yes stop_codon:yes gene_type:complete
MKYKSSANAELLFICNYQQHAYSAHSYCKLIVIQFFEKLTDTLNKQGVMQLNRLTSRQFTGRRNYLVLTFIVFTPEHPYTSLKSEM